MAGDVAEKPQGGSKKGLRRPKRRLSVRIDMTPMVDIAFLLLIFYMVSTVFAQPQAMEINLPKPDEIVDIEIKASNLLTLWVDADNTIFWMIGIPKGDSLPVQLTPKYSEPDSTGQFEIDSDSLIYLLRDRNIANEKLSTLLLIHRDANFSAMIELLDDIDLLERSFNARLAVDLKKDVKELTKADGRFSYRYATGKWEEPRHTRVIEAARRLALER